MYLYYYEDDEDLAEPPPAPWWAPLARALDPYVPDIVFVCSLLVAATLVLLHQIGTAPAS